MKRIWCALLCGSSLMSSSLVRAELPSTLNQVGRIAGAGWGDGYHACASSGCRLGADLPPKSYSQKYGRTASHPGGPIRRSVATFYDRFDAARRHHGQRHCDSPACDGPAEIYIQGSEVIQGPRIAPPPIHAASDTQTPMIPVPPPDVDNEAITWQLQPALPPSVADKQYPNGVVLNAPQVNGQPIVPNDPQRSQDREVAGQPGNPAERHVVIKPVTPKAVLNAPQSPRVQVPEANQLPLLPASVDAAPAASQVTPELDPPVRPRQRVAVTKTPTAISPLHPGNRLTSRSERLIREALGENFSMPEHLRRARDAALAKQPSETIVAPRNRHPEELVTKAATVQESPSGAQAPVMPETPDPEPLAEVETSGTAKAERALPAATLALPSEFSVPAAIVSPDPNTIKMPELRTTPARLPQYEPASRSRTALRLDSAPTVGSMPHAITLKMPEPRGSLAVDTTTQSQPTQLPAATPTIRERPSRLGQSLAQTKRPTRLGESAAAIEISLPPAPIQSNPLVGRPVVELAERIPDADSDVIRQPR